MKINNSTVTINVLDLDKSIQFYKSIGLSVQNRWNNHYAEMIAPAIIIGLHPTTEKNLKGNSGNVSIGFTTDDFKGAKSALNSLSIKVTERQEEGGQFLHFNDPDGTSLYFIKPKWDKN